MKKLALIIFVVILALYPCAVLATHTIISVIRIDASSGRVTGEGAEYTFVMPESWQTGSVTVNREKPNSSSAFLDKLTFLYIPNDRISISTVFATLYVCENKPNLQPPGSRKLLETDKYVFMFDSPSRNNFSEPADRRAFGQLITSAANDTMMANQIEVPQSQRRIPINTITVNGRLMRNKAVRNTVGTIYIPIRETCNALGYSVSWNAASREITIYSSARRHGATISLSGAFRQNYSTIIIDDRAYVTSVFFMSVLNANIDVDGRNNVVISTAGAGY